jgi:hypothetical protein
LSLVMRPKAASTSSKLNRSNSEQAFDQKGEEGWRGTGWKERVGLGVYRAVLC